MTKAEKSRLDRVAALGCVVCRNLGHGPTPASIHHIRIGQGGGQKSGHGLTIPLCSDHHQHGGHGVAFHAGRKEFEILYGSELDLLNQVNIELEG